MAKYRFLSFVLCLSLLCGCTPLVVEPGTEVTETSAVEPGTEVTETSAVEPVLEEPEVLLYEDMKAIWLSQFDLANVYRDGEMQREIGDFTEKTGRILDLVKEQGFNTVFLQIRPYGDSMYPSALFPLSGYVAVGTVEYDPVEIIVRLAHERSLSIHAWINPLRAMTEAEMETVSPDFTIRQWYDDEALRGKYIVSVGGRWYLNPAYEPVRELICAGAQEALDLYDFDGLHMDDYFYPTTEEWFDATAYQAAGGPLTLEDFRREQISILVQKLCGITHGSREGRIFGISPAGNVETVYHSQYADVYRWCREAGFLDYICPQVYFGLEHETHGFVKVCQTYEDMVTLDSVSLIIGMTFGKAFTREDPWAGTGQDEWKNSRDILARCLETTKELGKCRGVAVFSYQYLFDPLTGEPIPETEAERAAFAGILKDISWN